MKESTIKDVKTQDNKNKDIKSITASFGAVSFFDLSV